MSQYFPETMVVFTTTVSGIIKTDSGSGAERLCWRNLMAARSDIRRAQRLIVCVWDYPQDQSHHRLCTFSTAAAAIFLKISPQNNLLQELIERRRKVVPCNRSVTFSGSVYTSAFQPYLSHVRPQHRHEVPFTDIKPQLCSFKLILYWLSFCISINIIQMAINTNKWKQTLAFTLVDDLLCMSIYFIWSNRETVTLFYFIWFYIHFNGCHMFTSVLLTKTKKNVSVYKMCCVNKI